jgi:hypothetical protein
VDEPQEMLSKRSQAPRHLAYLWNLRKSNSENEDRIVFTRGQGWENGERRDVFQKYKVSVRQKDRSFLHSLVTTVNSNVW